MADLNLQGRVLAQKYELVRLLGQGGMGAVYEARNHLGKRFAVKLLLKPEFAQDPQLAARFFREAKASAAIESEHIVEVYDTGVDPQTNFPFIIMELLKGEDLEHTIVRLGALSPVAATRIISQAAVGLGKAHASGIIHRDIKPANIFMTQRDSGDSIVKILDFGIAKHSLDALASADGAGLTKTGSMLGTPLYMSPEQAQGAKGIDHRSDVWSLAMCLYEALSGNTPWGDLETLGALILAICSRDVRPLQDVAPWIPPELAQVVHRGLARDPNLRIQTAPALVEALRPFTGGSMQITADLMQPVGAEHRGSIAARADIPSLSVAGVTSGSGNTTIARKKSNAPVFVALGLFAVVVVGGGVFAVTRLTGNKDAPKTTAAATETASETAKPAPTKEPANPEPPPQAVAKNGLLGVKAPKGSLVKVGKDDVTGNIKDGKLPLSGDEGDSFIVSIWNGKTMLMSQKVYMGDGFLIPEEIDVSKGEVSVKPPPKPGTAKTAGTTTAAGTNVPPKGEGTGTVAKPKPTVETTFE